eukprot:gene8377-biopygen8491
MKQFRLMFTMLTEQVKALREDASSSTSASKKEDAKRTGDAELEVLANLPDLFTPSRLGGSELLGASGWDAIMFHIPSSQRVSCHLRGSGVEPKTGDTEEYGEVRPDDKIQIFWPEDQEWYLGTVGETGEDGKKPAPWKTALMQHWQGELEGSQFASTAVEMQAGALQKMMAGNYERPACTWGGAFATFSRPQTGTAMRRESLSWDNEGLSVVLQKEKGRNLQLQKRRLWIPVNGVAGLHELLELWEEARDGAWLRVLTYIDPTAVVDGGMAYYFGSVLYGLRLLLPGTTTTTTTATTTGDAEFKKLKKLPYCPYAAANPFPKRPDAMTNDMLKLSDLHGDKTQTMLCIKSNSSMKFEQMVLGPALAYFHNAIVYEETPMDKI